MRPCRPAANSSRIHGFRSLAVARGAMRPQSRASASHNGHAYRRAAPCVLSQRSFSSSTRPHGRPAAPHLLSQRSLLPSKRPHSRRVEKSKRPRRDKVGWARCRGRRAPFVGWPTEPQLCQRGILRRWRSLHGQSKREVQTISQLAKLRRSALCGTWAPSLSRPQNQAPLSVVVTGVGSA